MGGENAEIAQSVSVHDGQAGDDDWLTLEPPDRRHRAAAPWWAALNPDDPDRSANRAKLVSWAAVLTLGVALAMLAAPPAISWLTRSTGSFGAIMHFIGFGGQPSWSLPALAGLIAATAAVARFCQAGLARWNALTGQANTANWPAMLAGWLRQRLTPWLASAVIVGCGAVLALRWTDGARAGYSPAQLVPVIAALAVTVLGRAAVNVNRISLHDVYRWRLADAFAVTRRAAQARTFSQARRLFAEAAATRLSQLRGDTGAAEQPGLVICGTANINANREVPPGSGGFCISFDPDLVTLRRRTCAAGEDDATAPTAGYEALVGERRCTLFDVSAISGAAISPLMGAATQQAYRILLTLTNVRLGVWLPHPAVVSEAGKIIKQRAAGLPGRPDKRWTRHPLLLLLWYLSPHPLWDRKADLNLDREARLWAHVLRLRLDKRLAGEVWYRLMQRPWRGAMPGGHRAQPHHHGRLGRRPGHRAGGTPLGLRDVQPAARQPRAARTGRHLGVQARLVDRRALGRPGLRQGSFDLPVRQHARAAVRRRRVRGLPRAWRSHAAGRRQGVHATASASVIAVLRALRQWGERYVAR
jgi:hypothetical protein